MTQAFLHMRHKSSTHSQVAVFKEIDMQLIQVGVDFGVDEDNTNSSPVFNRILHWENDLYAINDEYIYRYDVQANSGTWETFYTWAATSSAVNNYRGGLTPCSINGSGVLITGYAGGFDDYKLVKIDKDLNITEYINTGGISAWGTAGAAFMAGAISYRNSIIFWNRTQSNPVAQSYDIETNTFTTITLPWNVHSPHNQMCVFNDRVYIVVPKNSERMYLWRLDGGAFTDLGAVSVGNGPNEGSSDEGGGALIESDGKLFALYCNRGSFSWSASELNINSDGGLDSWADVTSVIIPASLTAKSTSTGSLGVIRTDCVSDPTSPIYEFLVYSTVAEGQSVDLYRWSNHPSGEMSFINAGLDSSRYSSINTNNGTGGGRVWSGSGVINVSQPDLSLNLNGLDIDANFILYGPSPSLGGVSLELYFDKEGEITSTRGTISSTTHGSIVANRVTGLTADNLTEITVGWGAVTDGIQIGDNPTLAAKVFIP